MVKPKKLIGVKAERYEEQHLGTERVWGDAGEGQE